MGFLIDICKQFAENKANKDDRIFALGFGSKTAKVVNFLAAIESMNFGIYEGNEDELYYELYRMVEKEAKSISRYYTINDLKRDLKIEQDKVADIFVEQKALVATLNKNYGFQRNKNVWGGTIF